MKNKMTCNKITPKDIKLVKKQLDILNNKQDEEIDDNAIDNPLFPY